MLYALLALGCVAWHLGSQRLDRLANQASLVLAFSGLAHLGIFFICAPSAEYRFALWLTVSSLFSVLLAGTNFLTCKSQK